MSRAPLSLQWRVTLLVALVISIGLGTLGWTVLHSVRNHFAVQDADELGQVVQAVEQALQHQQHLDSPHQMAIQHALLGHHGIYVMLINDHNQTVYQTPGPDLTPALALLPAQTASSQPRLGSWNADEHPLRGALITLPGHRLLVASDMTFHLHFLADFETSLLLITLGIGLLTLLAVWLSIHQGHAPLRQLGQHIAGIGSGQLHQRLDSNAYPAELQELTQAFNHMLARLEEGFERLSNFSADIAHELRTPLTNLITQTQVALSQQRRLEDYRELLYSSLEEEERLSRMVADMLWLAKTDNGLLTPRSAELDLNHEVADLFEFFEAWADEQQVMLSCTGTAPTITGDRDMLRRAISNLLSNAIQHTSAGATVHLQLGSEAIMGSTFASLAIANPGQPIAAEHLPRLFDRFYRVDASRQRTTDGTGLGLAIASSIARLHGGQIRVTSDQQATCFTLLLPVG